MNVSNVFISMIGDLHIAIIDLLEYRKYGDKQRTIMYI